MAAIRTPPIRKDKWLFVNSETGQIVNLNRCWVLIIRRKLFARDREGKVVHRWIGEFRETYHSEQAAKDAFVILGKGSLDTEPVVKKIDFSHIVNADGIIQSPWKPVLDHLNPHVGIKTNSAYRRQ